MLSGKSIESAKSSSQLPGRYSSVRAWTNERCERNVVVVWWSKAFINFPVVTVISSFCNRLPHLRNFILRFRLNLRRFGRHRPRSNHCKQRYRHRFDKLGVPLPVHHLKAFVRFEFFVHSDTNDFWLRLSPSNDAHKNNLIAINHFEPLSASSFVCCSFVCTWLSDWSILSNNPNVQEIKEKHATKRRVKFLRKPKISIFFRFERQLFRHKEKRFKIKIKKIKTKINAFSFGKWGGGQ